MVVTQPVLGNNFCGVICFASLADVVGVLVPRTDNFDGGNGGIDERSSKGWLKGHGIPGAFITASE